MRTPVAPTPHSGHIVTNGETRAGPTAPRRRPPSAVKRAVDLVGAVVALVLLSPVLLAVSVLVWLVQGRPILFAQTRPGMGGRPFVIYKFRTMTADRDAEGQLLRDTHRLTKLGRILRSTSLDELPELINVIKGDMSLVGPRPLLMHYLPHYTPREFTRHDVRPGVTGWAQVNGRNMTTWNERLEMDAWYVENWSLWLDFRILAKTVLQVVRRHGVAVDTSKVEMDLARERTLKAVGVSSKECSKE